MTEQKDMDDLDALFAELRNHPAPEMSETLSARILGDADRLQPTAPPVTPVAKQGWLAGMVSALGGWPSMGGLAAAGVAGLWIGMAPPAALSDLSAQVIGEDLSVTLYSDAAYGIAGMDG